MQNSLQFYSGYNSYPTEEGFLSNPPNTTIENEVYGLCPSTSINTHQMPIMTQPTSLGMSTSKKRKATIDTDASYSPASIYSDNSNYSDTSYPTFSHCSTELSRGIPSNRNDSIIKTTKLTSTEEGSSDDNDDDDEENDLARKREKHTQVEAQRRALEKAHFKELSTLISNRNDSKSTKLHHLDLLKIAADQINEMNSRHKHDPLRPSNLTESEANFLTIEASNSFLFVTTIEPQSVFRIIHVTDSINRILNTTPDQWKRQNLLSFVHPDDFLRTKSQLMSLNQGNGVKIRFECRLKQGNSDTYSSVNIDGMTKMIDNTLKPLKTNVPGFLAFIGICHLPLITKYSETNMSLYKDHQLSILRCRCSPHDWKIFLVDRSVSTLPSISYDLLRQKSILDFIPTSEQGHVLQALLRSTTASSNETITCHFIHPNLPNLILMTLEIKSFFNPILHRADFIELTFKTLNNPINTKLETSILDFMNDTKEIEKLLESESLILTQQAIEQQQQQQQLHNNQLNQTTPFYYSNDWPTKNELF